MRLQIGVMTFFSFFFLPTLSAFEAGVVPQDEDAHRTFVTSALGYVDRQILNSFIEKVGKEKHQPVDIWSMLWERGDESDRMLLQIRKLLDLLLFSTSFEQKKEVMHHLFTGWDYAEWRREIYALFWGRHSMLACLQARHEYFAQVRSCNFNQKEIDDWCKRVAGGDRDRLRLLPELARTICFMDIERFLLDLLPPLSLEYELGQQAYGSVEKRYTYYGYWQAWKLPEAEDSFNRYQKHLYGILRGDSFKSKRLMATKSLVELRHAHEECEREIENIRAKIDTADSTFRRNRQAAFHAGGAGMARLSRLGVAGADLGAFAQILFKSTKLRDECAAHFKQIELLHIKHYEVMLECVIIQKLCEAAETGATDTFNEIAEHYDMPVRMGVQTGIAFKLAARMPLIRSLQRVLQARLIPFCSEEAPLKTDHLRAYFDEKGGTLNFDEQLLLLLSLLRDAHEQRKLLSVVVQETPIAREYFDSLRINSSLLSQFTRQKNKQHQLLMALLKEWITGGPAILTPDDFAAILSEPDFESIGMISAELFPRGMPLPPLKEISDEDVSDDESYTEEELDAIDSYRQAYVWRRLYALGEEIVRGLVFEREVNTLPPVRGATSPRRGSDEASAGAGSLSSQSISSGGRSAGPQTKLVIGKKKKKTGKKKAGKSKGKR